MTSTCSCIFLSYIFFAAVEILLNTSKNYTQLTLIRFPSYDYSIDWRVCVQYTYNDVCTCTLEHTCFHHRLHVCETVSHTTETYRAHGRWSMRYITVFF